MSKTFEVCYGCKRPNYYPEFFVTLVPDGRECDCEDGHLGGCASFKKTDIIVSSLDELNYVMVSYPHMRISRFGPVTKG